MSSHAEQAPWFMGMIGGCTNCFSLDTETFERGAVKEVRFNELRMARQAQIVSEAQFHDQAAESNRDDDSVAPSSTSRPASLAADGAATPRDNTPMNHQLLRAASIDMIKVRQRDHAKYDAMWRKVEAEIAEDTKHLRMVLSKLDIGTKERLLSELKQKVETVKAYKDRIRELEREITDLNITKRMGVAPFHTQQSAHLKERAKDGVPNTGRSTSSGASSEISSRRASRNASSGTVTDRPRSKSRGRE